MRVGDRAAMTTIVRTPSGDLRCDDSTEGLVVARGIRFGESPAGERRFLAPVAAEPWDGIRDALEPGPTSPQNPAMLSAVGEIQDEDCLFLNVWTPQVEPPAPLPVMVWIHGGGFTTGSGSTPWYDGSALARRGVVVVTFNYRLGALGFLDLGAVGGHAYQSSGNCGMLDQVLALEWVRDHISCFGGDPGQVTLFGESAGAMSVGTHLGMPASVGLFHRAILESGSARNVSSPEHARSTTDRVLESIGVSTVEELQVVPVQTLLEAQASASQISGPDLLPFQPVLDGVVLERQPLDAVASGAAGDIDIIIGTTADEAKLFTSFVPSLLDSDEAALLRRIGRVVDGDPEEVVAVYRRRLADLPPKEVFDAAFTDRIFRIPAIELAELQVAAGASVWMYVFAERSDSFDGALGACHAIEIPFVWDNLDAHGVQMLLGERTDARRALAHDLADTWVRFAVEGDPGHVGAADWPPYGLSDRQTLMITAADVRSVADPLADERLVWPVRAPGTN